MSRSRARLSPACVYVCGPFLYRVILAQVCVPHLYLFFVYDRFFLFAVCRETVVTFFAWILLKKIRTIT